MVDGLLRVVASGGLLATALVAPNVIQALDKPLNKYFDQLDKRARDRELHRILRYMKTKDLIKGNYEHGLAITKKGRERAERAEFDNLQIQKPGTWDKRWRIVLYDIPEEKKHGRNSLAFKLRSLGCYQLQKSIWVHPYPCKNEIEAITVRYDVEKYVTYIVTSYIDKQDLLKRRFSFLK
jgi:DNA-binding transcriptional regulator PaaX